MGATLEDWETHRREDARIQERSPCRPFTPAPVQRWRCLAAEVPHEAAEVVANFLVELGSLGVVEGEQDISQPPTPTTEVRGFFPAEVSGPALHAALVRYLADLSALFPEIGQCSPRLFEVTSDAWQDRWREHFPPVAVGERFVLLPPWEVASRNTDRIVIVINPGMAFGTGHHATTQTCLEAMEYLWERGERPEKALDLGTGSGILAIALVTLGAHVWATDIDPVALDEARKNIATNAVASSIHLSDRTIEQLPTPFPLVVANLFATTLIALAPTLSATVETQGYAILSGIQSEQEQEVHAAYSPLLWRVKTRFIRDDWVTLVLQRA